MKNKKIAFTLVELIVTITILAILWTIGFLSFQSYTVYSRDVVRLSHISNMKSVLEYNYTETWRYPKPDWENNITYSWAIAWIQWDFWKDTKRKTKRLDSIPLDPLTQNTYSYSVTKNQSEFELGSIFEWDEVSKNNSILNNSYADNSDFKAYISWNYNWQILKVKSWSVDYILAVPSIILSDYTDLRLEDIIDNANSKFVLNWYNNIPSNYWMTNSGSWELDFLKKENFVVFEWNLESLSESWSLQEELWTKLALAYSWTTIENNSGIKEIVNAHSWNKLYLTQNIIKSTLIPKFEITAVSVTNWCASQPNYTNANFVAWTAISENQVWQNIDSNEACYYSCRSGYEWENCIAVTPTTIWLISHYPLSNNGNDYFWNNHWIGNSSNYSDNYLVSGYLELPNYDSKAISFWAKSNGDFEDSIRNAFWKECRIRPFYSSQWSTFQIAVRVWWASLWENLSFSFTPTYWVKYLYTLLWDWSSNIDLYVDGYYNSSVTAPLNWNDRARTTLVQADDLYIRNVRFYDRVLSQNEVLEIYNYEK